MKRSAAILGPTPSFVRWAIRFDCPLRELSKDDLPDTTFRQLRGLRELSHGIRQKRVSQGVCIHPELNVSADTAKGFFAEEICEVFGGADFVDACCHNCEANACQRVAPPSSTMPSIWAGCYGWFPSRYDQIDYIDEFQTAMATSAGLVFHNSNNPTTPNWYGLWRNRYWSGRFLKSLRQILQIIIERRSPTTPPDRNLLEINAAAQQCLDCKLSLETELIPAGHSDGSHWRLEPHCPECRKEMTAEQTQCLACGRLGNPQSSSKRKVLGQRPYSLLHRLVGRSQTEKLLVDYHGSKPRAESDQR